MSDLKYTSVRGYMLLGMYVLMTTAVKWGGQSQFNKQLDFKTIAMAARRKEKKTSNLKSCVQLQPKISKLSKI